MATRLYLPSSGTSPVNPAWSASWYDATSFSAEKLIALTTRGDTAMVTKTMTEADQTDRHFACGMWITDRLAQQTIVTGQAVTISICCSETDRANNMSMHWVIRVLHADNTYGDDVVAFRDEGNEAPLTASIASRYDTVNTAANIEIQGGDRLVIEIGMGGDPTGSGSHNCSMIIGNNNATTDLNAADADTVTTRNPWVNFATSTLTFMRKRSWVTHS